MSCIDSEAYFYFLCLSFIALEDSSASISKELANKDFLKVLSSKLASKTPKLVNEIINFVSCIATKFPNDSTNIVVAVQAAGFDLVEP